MILIFFHRISHWYHEAESFLLPSTINVVQYELTDASKPTKLSEFIEGKKEEMTEKRKE